MLPYILLVVYIVLSAIYARVCYPKSTKKERSLFLYLTFAFIYMFCCFRSFDVGRDVAAYLTAYQKTERVPWDNWRYIYFEYGYIALMKVCIAVGLSFRIFFFIIYAIILWPIMLFIREKSPYPFLSVIIYISFQFFIFNLTGIRQSIAISILMLSYLVLSKDYCKKRLLKFLLLVGMAALFHKSAIIFSLAYPISRLKLNKKTIGLFCVTAALGYFFNILGVGAILDMFENSHYKYSTDDSQQLGFLIVAMAGIVFLSVWTYFNAKGKNKVQYQYVANILMASMSFMFLFNGSVLLRSVMYYYFPMIISLPMFVNTLKNLRLRRLVYIGIALVFLAFFFIREVYSLDAFPYMLGEDLWGYLAY